MSKMICITGDGAFLASDNITAPEYINATLMAQLNIFNNLVKQGAPKEQLYDMYNEAASAFLATFAPDIERRPDLTAEAIFEAENQLLEKKATKIANFSPRQKRVEQLKNKAYQDAADPAIIKKIEEAGASE